MAAVTLRVNGTRTGLLLCRRPGVAESTVKCSTTDLSEREASTSLRLEECHSIPVIGIVLRADGIVTANHERKRCELPVPARQSSRPVSQGGTARKFNFSALPSQQSGALDIAYLWHGCCKMPTHISAVVVEWESEFCEKLRLAEDCVGTIYEPRGAD
jgi:hypothetical protein